MNKSGRHPCEKRAQIMNVILETFKINANKLCGATFPHFKDSKGLQDRKEFTRALKIGESQ